MTYNQKIIFYISLVVATLSLTSGSFLYNLTKNNVILNTNQQNQFIAGIHSILVVEGAMIQSATAYVEDVEDYIYQPIILKRPNFKSYSKLNNESKNIEVIPQQLPILVIYDDELVIEFPKIIATSRNIKRAVVRVLLSKHPQTEKNLLIKSSFNLKETPYFYKKIADQNNYSIRYPKQAYDYANFILNNMVEDFSDVEGDFVLVHIPLIQANLTGIAKYYENWVGSYSAEYNVSPSLVYAIMETESAFNSQAVSSSNAIGLMQLKANAGGKDVHNMIDKKQGSPSVKSLFNSENNIRMGVAYLGLLKHDYFSRVKNKKNKEMMAISSYNGGLNTVLKLFGSTPERAIAKVNRMNPDQVYNILRFKHKSQETRQYLDKVLKANLKYKQQLNLPLERF